MDRLFPSEPRPLPAPSGITWRVVFTDGSSTTPEPVQHAIGYADFVAYAARFGTDARSLLDLWTFAHFVRAHRERLEADAELLRSAVIFLGNAMIALHPDCFWTNGGNGLSVGTDPGDAVEVAPGEWRYPGPQQRLGVEGTVPALLEADDQRFLEFGGVVAGWGTPGPFAGRASRDVETDAPTPPPSA